MSLFDNLASMATGALSGDFTAIVTKAKQALEDGVSTDSPLALEIAEMVVRQFPQLEGKAALVEQIDDLIPDSIQSNFGFTPEVMNFIKKALGGVSSVSKHHS